MAAFAKLAAERVISTERQQQILFGLCRMAALTVREQVGMFFVDPTNQCDSNGFEYFVKD